jgi:hypothetical protein
VHMQLQLRQQNVGSEVVVDHVKDKGKEKVVEKIKEPMRIEDVELVYLSDCEVADQKLLSNNNDTDDKAVTNPKGMDVGNGAGMCS